MDLPSLRRRFPDGGQPVMILGTLEGERRVLPAGSAPEAGMVRTVLKA